VPLVRTARPVYRQNVPQRIGGERDVVVMFCDFRNRAELAADHLPQDQLYVLTIYAEAIGHAVRSSGGAISYVEFDCICALFGVEGATERCAQQALQAAGAIEGVITDLNDRLGSEREGRIRIAVSIHAGRAAVGEIGSSDPPVMLALGDAVDVANELRKAADTRGKPFAISETVYAAAKIEPVFEDKVMLPSPGGEAPIAGFLSDKAPIPSPSWTLHGQQGRRATLQRLLGR
jgi:adenylate cyclase